MEIKSPFSYLTSGLTSQLQPGPWHGGCSRHSPRPVLTLKFGLHIWWEQRQALTTLQLAILTWARFVNWQTGPWPVEFTRSSTSGTCDTMTFWSSGRCFWHEILKSVLVCSLMVPYDILWYFMIYFENIFWRILYFVHIFECIYSHPLTDVHSTTRSSGRYVTLLLAPARGHGPFLSIRLCLFLDISLKQPNL